MTQEIKKAIDELIEVETYFSSILDHAAENAVLMPNSYRWARKLVREKITELSRKLYSETRKGAQVKALAEGVEELQRFLSKGGNND